MKSGALIAVLAVSALATVVARADTPPSPWQLAADRAARIAWATHLEYERRIADADAMGPGSFVLFGDGGIFVEGARGVLEEAGARQSSNPLLRFDLGLCYERLGHHVQAAEVLAEALERWPDHRLAEEGWVQYAFANAHLGHPEEERRGYEKYLAIVTEVPRRLVPTLNLAEADMRAGDLDRAAAGYREVLRQTARLPNTVGNAQTSALAQWGLAVALDRQGDVFGGARAAGEATQMDPPGRDTNSYAGRSRDRTPVILDESSVFFVPAYERTWYLALGEAALAKAEADPRRALGHWRSTEAFWEKYLAGARAAKPADRWLHVAELRLRAVQARRADAETRAAKLPPLPSPRGIFID